MKRIRRVAALLAFASALAPFCAAQEITVAAAADLQFAMQQIAARFQQKTGNRVKLTYGSSGNFYQQLSNGAPFDVFFSANLEYAKRLQTSGLTESGSYYPYARGQLVLWVRNDSKVNLDSGLRAVLDPAVKTVAIANPQHAPYGQAAVAALRKEALYGKVQNKLVLGENISQTASFVLSGSADAGILALSLALSPNMKSKGRYAEIPSADYPPIEQACVILRSSRNKAVAEEFLSFVKTPEAGDILRSYGFSVPKP